MDKLEYRNVDAEIRATEDTEMIVEGYAAKFNCESEPLGFMGIRESIDPQAFAQTLNEDKQYLHWNHNDDIVLGSTKSGTLSLNTDDVGLHFRAQFPNSPEGISKYTSVKRGDVSQMSFGFQTRKEEWDETDPKNMKRKLLDVRLFEVSLVAYPAYPQTNAQARSIDEVVNEYRAAHPQPVPDLEPKFDVEKEAEYWSHKSKTLY